MSTTDLPGSSLLANRYRLVERLGAGGMSVVWRGFDEVLGRQVAVKVLPPSTSADPSFRRRLRAEAQAAARLSHPHITNVYDYGEATTVDGEPVPYVVMELIDGESLAAVLARTRRLPWQAAVRISAEVAAALAAAHSRGIVHRDVTPANVMLTSSGAKVVDFGISALIGENDIDPDGSLLGTPAYLAPERLEGGQVSPATDVYAVGLLIYRSLIGQLPWDVGTTTALLRAHQYTEPEPLPPVEGLPPAVAALIGRCLEKRPADRPSSAELAHVLAGISAGAPVVARGFGPDWSPDNGEDTTILPPQHSYALPQHLPYSPPAQPGSPSSPASADEAAAARNNRFAVLAAAGPVGDVPPAPPESGNPSLRPAYGNQAAAPGGPPVPPTSNDGRSGAAAGDHRGPGRSGRPNTRRVLVLAGVVMLLGVATYGWSLTNGPAKKAPDAFALPSPSVVAPSGKCVVSYAVWSDANGRFSAQVTLANRNDTAVKDWKLWFIMPGDQVVSGNGKVQLDQQDHAVTVASVATLNPQKTLTMPITGRYTKNNAAPLAFKLNGSTCETFVSSKPGEPSRQVEHLSNGQVRLGSTPSTSAPVPGISVDPGGIVHITPTTAPAPIPGTTSGAITTTLPTVGPTTPSATRTPDGPVVVITTPTATIAPVLPDLPTTPPTTTPPTTDPTTFVPPGPITGTLDCDTEALDEDCPVAP
ncbi:serine/threonine-protein kinase [Micromonosporaceae bacterium Da 78-11]